MALCRWEGIGFICTPVENKSLFHCGMMVQLVAFPWNYRFQRWRLFSVFTSLFKWNKTHKCPLQFRYLWAAVPHALSDSVSLRTAPCNACLKQTQIGRNWIEMEEGMHQLARSRNRKGGRVQFYRNKSVYLLSCSGNSPTPSNYRSPLSSQPFLKSALLGRVKSPATTCPGHISGPWQTEHLSRLFPC